MIRILLFSLSFAFYSCATHRLHTQIATSHKKGRTISSYHFKFSAATKRLRADIKNESTMILGDIKRVSEIPFKGCHLEIEVDEGSNGGASGSEILGALTLWMLPTWTTREKKEMFTVNIYDEGKIKNSQVYHIDEIVYSQVVVIPFALFQHYSNSRYYKLLSYYKEILELAKSKGC